MSTLFKCVVFTTKLLHFFPYENKIGVLTLGGPEWQHCLGQFNVNMWLRTETPRQICLLWNCEVKNRSETRWQLDLTWIYIISFRNIIQTTFLLDSRLTKVYWKALKITWTITLLAPHTSFFKKCSYILILSYWMGKVL